MPPDRPTRRDFLKGAALLPAAAVLSACRRDAARRVNFFNWSNYIAPETLPEFTRRTGVEVRYDLFADEEEMFAKLRAGARGYDLAVAGDYLIPRLSALNMLAAIPAAAIPGMANLAPRFRRPSYDPDETSVPYLWGTTGIAYNRKSFPRPPDSWRDLWDPRHKNRVSMLDNARDCISVAMQLLGVSQATRDPGDFARVRELLLRQKPLVKQYSSASYLDGLVSGEIDLAMAWSGDLLQAARDNPDLDYRLPREGTYMWIDCLVLLRGAPHREDALRLVDYLLEPAAAAGIANHVRYATPNAAALPRVDPALRRDPRVFPAPGDAAKLRLHEPLDAEQSAIWNELWADVKAS